ncbi:hypothetical protein [Candidatus Finniella inopinata]|uniref:G domain-containing protein n=1 Tax=Candidatus Finniella inopinata TaxID=1696036 RepID=A0A4Q7DHD3_9PROT|nr:hypothetical protein [Candidatus Finniella inopinata]RZI45314.1 hypothetical protein EQU50_07585 [Candidatus Finniella inopinata]
MQQEIQNVSQRVNASRATHGDAPSTIVIGTSSHGKSTLITYLAGKPLVSSKGPRGFVLNTTDPLPGFTIGSSVGVGTRLPSSWYDSSSRVVYWDCPGFNDSRGPDTDVVNAFSIQQLFRPPSNVKIVIALREAELQQNSANFADLLKRVVDTFPDSDQLHQCISLVVTMHRDVDVEEVLKDIFAHSADNALFNETRVKSLVKFLSDNVRARVSVFPYPTAEGAYSATGRDPILQSINSSSFVRNIRSNVVVPARAREQVRELSLRTNQTIENYLRTTVFNCIERKAAAIIGRHERTGREMKADFASYAQMLTDVRQDNALNFIQDLQAVFGRLGGGVDHLNEIKKNVELLDSFRPLSTGVEYQMHRWKSGLGNSTTRLRELGNAPTQRINRRDVNQRELDDWWQIGDVFGKNRRNWGNHVALDRYEQDSTEFPGNLTVVDLETKSGTLIYGYNYGERGNSKWRHGPSFVSETERYI